MSGLLIFKRIKLVASTNNSSAVAEIGDRARAKLVEKTEKWRTVVLLSVGDLGPHLTQCRPGPSGILIHPTIWPQYTNVTDRTTVP